MAKIVTSKVLCACCGQEVKIERLLSFSAKRVGLSGNKHDSFQYIMEECPECHYTSFDIEDNNVRVSKGMLNAFRIKKEVDCISDVNFISILKAADIYEKNKDYCRYAECLRLASFYAEDLQNTSIARNLLKQANEALQTYFENRDELDYSDIMLAIILVDGNRRLGMTATAGNLCEELYSLIDDSEELANMRRLVEFEKILLQNRDITEHFISEVL